MEKLYQCLLEEQPEIKVDAAIADKARIPIERMLEMSENIKK
ncbi:MAG: quinolinate synthase NadA, partial [Muribaculaceae bacterium]|nr:quinolinate synthase NadA [Muribaculaceae bacterium]